MAFERGMPFWLIRHDQGLEGRSTRQQTRLVQGVCFVLDGAGLSPRI